MAVEVWGGAATPIGRVTGAVRLWAWELAVFGVSFVVIALTHTRKLSTDGFLALSGGREVSAHGLPSTDPMTVAGAGRAWIDQQWLGQAVLYRIWQAGGYPALAIVSAGLVSLSLAMLCFLLRRRGAAPRRALKWTTLALCGGLADVSARTQDFAYPLFVVLMILLFRDVRAAARPSWRWVVTVLAVLVLWANLHGSVLVGVAVVSTVCAYRATTGARGASIRYLLVAAAAPLTVVATPYGLSIVRYYEAVLGNSAIREYSSEWQPALPTSVAAVGYLAVVLTVVAVVCWAWRRGAHPGLELGVTALVLGVAGLSALRWGAWASFVAVVLATDILNTVDPARVGRSAPPRMLVPGVAALVAAVVIALVSADVPAFVGQAPLGAMSAASRYAERHPAARVLADDVSASALLWLHPDLRGRVGFDGRLEVFRQSAVRAWGDYIRARPGSMALARQYQVLVVSSSNGSLADAVRGLAHARTIYDGSDGVVVVLG